MTGVPRKQSEISSRKNLCLEIRKINMKNGTNVGKGSKHGNLHMKEKKRRTQLDQTKQEAEHRNKGH